MMKKKFLLIVGVMIAVSFQLAAGDVSCGVGFWFDAPRGVSSTEVEGLSIGLPVANHKSVEGLGLALCGNCSQDVYGLQLVMLGVNSVKTLTGVQIGFINLVKKSMQEIGVQLGTFNHSGSRGIQLGLINNCSDNADLQLGLVNVNKNGLFPVMIIFNCSSNFN